MIEKFHRIPVSPILSRDSNEKFRFPYKHPINVDIKIRLPRLNSRGEDINLSHS